MDAKGNVKEEDVIICLVDEWHSGDKSAFDGDVVSVKDDGVDVIYLSGYRSRNDFIPWADILAKVDLSQARVNLANAPYEGHFQVFGAETSE